MQALGHKNIKNTLLYVQLEEALFQGETDNISKVAKTEKDICSLDEAGFVPRARLQNALWLSVPGTRLVFMGHRYNSWISFGVSSAI